MTAADLISAADFVAHSSSLAGLRRDLIAADVLLKRLLEQYGENHPQVREVRAGRNEIIEKTNEELEGMKKGQKASYEIARTRYEALNNELNLVKEQDIEFQGSKMLPFEKALDDLDSHRTILKALQARIAQEGIELEIPRTPVELVDPAEPDLRHVKPNLLLNLFLSLLAGLGAGIGLAYFIEYLDTSVKTVDDVERYLSLPVIGVIPQKVCPLVEERPNNPHAEAYRVLRTNMQFANKGITGGTYVVVSGGLGEGKSTTLFNLAYVSAQLGDKVLIIDSDLRRPVQHTYLKKHNRVGLTNVLMREVSLDDVIKPTKVPNLHFLPSGKPPGTSVGLLDSQRMRELVKNLKARYDNVFFDSPPIVGISDASILSSEVDGVLLVVQYRKYPRVISSRAKRMIENVGGNVVGVVLNNINILRDDYYYYYHSYYSHYYDSKNERPEDAAPEEPLLVASDSTPKKDF